tara:strand:- start:238 stop:480 length:243 start_codon:yes stop_codon:yes gene_type:complete
MHYLIAGKERVYGRTFSYSFEGDFTKEELQNKVRESYSTEHNITLEDPDPQKVEIGDDAEGEIDFSFSHVYKSETPISDY